MKITKEQLQEIIKEELIKITEMYDRNLFGDEDRELPEPEEDNSYASGPQFSEAEQQAVDAINAAADAIVNMGQSNPEMTDTYIGLFRVLERAGVNTEAVARMA